jgi:riboflavin synthase
MFTGIITDIGTIKALEQRGDLRATIETHYATAGIDLGASIACSGVCLTVIDKGANWFTVDISGETLRCSNASAWELNTRLNLERALKVGDELGGHIVSGHVDGVGSIIAIEPAGDSHVVRFAASTDLAPYIAPKGSVTLNGVSLTVNEVTDVDDGVHFTINVIPHTWQHTSFGSAAVGDAVNIEIDVLARYLSRMKAVLS